MFGVMPDVSGDVDDILDDISSFDAEELGRKIIEMADRLDDVAAAVPGAQATYIFEMDDKRYKVVLTKD